ncbi:MAG: hypothetical protein IBX62_06730 [Coriobacteriia bacterium]|nr:hypothetical protein [Coriobacteriia bacterium]
MALAETLGRVEADIERGDLGKARDRLLGLLRTYPANLYVRDRLGEVYWRLQYPELAGRYWYLFEPVTPEMERACAAFERKFAADARPMLAEISYRGGIDAIAGSFAERRLRELAAAAGADLRCLEPRTRRRRTEREAVIGGAAFLIIATCMLVFSLVGIVVTLQWLFHAFD